MNKDWNVVDLLHMIDLKYKDIDNYFINDIPFFEYGDRQYNSISLSRVEFPLSVKEMLSKE